MPSTIGIRKYADSGDENATSQSESLLVQSLLHSKTIGPTLKPILLHLPQPLNSRRSENKIIYIIAAFALGIVFLLNVCSRSEKIIHPLHASKHGPSDYDLAYRESLGFFNDIPSEEWLRKKERVQTQPKHNDEKFGLRSKYLNRNHPSIWYQNNWQVEFTCPHEIQLGGASDGSKWTCDPHRISKNKKGENRDPCLVYSFGRGSPNARRFEFSFELDLLEHLDGDGCEVHVFDHRLKDFGGNIPENIIAHSWSLEAETDAALGRRDSMTLREIVTQLGHKGREVDVFRLDCSGCEWNTYKEWLTSGVEIKQILVELHGAPRNEDTLFEELESHGYVIFHNEPDVRVAGIWQEFGFLRLSADFFHGDNR